MARRKTSGESGSGNGSDESVALVPFKTIVNVGQRELTIGGASGEATIQVHELPALKRSIALFENACGEVETVKRRKRRKGGRRALGKAARKSAAEEVSPRRSKRSTDDE